MSLKNEAANLFDSMKSGVADGVKQCGVDQSAEVLLDLATSVLGKDHTLLKTEQGRELSKSSAGCDFILWVWRSWS